MTSVAVGSKGRMRSSGHEFEIVGCTSKTSVIRYRWEHRTHEVYDEDLRKDADSIEEWSKVE